MRELATAYIVGPTGWQRSYLRKLMAPRFSVFTATLKEFQSEQNAPRDGGAVILLLPGESGGGRILETGIFERGVPVLLVETERTADTWLIEGLSAGAAGAVAMPATADLVESALGVHLRGGVSLTPRTGRLLVRFLQQTVRQPAGWNRLTPRERQLVEAVLTGLPNKLVSDLLKISEKTVETHLTHIYRKLGVQSRSELIARFAPMHVNGNGAQGGFEQDFGVQTDL